MGNKKNSDKWLPADHLRIKAFARSLVSGRPEAHLGQEPKTSDIQAALFKLAHPIDISAPAIRSWVVGEKFPSTSYVNWIKQCMPECADWLTPVIDSSPIRRFLCALDLWGAPIDSAVRNLDAASAKITVGKSLVILAKRWAPMPIGDGRCTFGGFAIPRLKCFAPVQVPDSLYQSVNLLTLMDFMFRCGPYIKLTDEEFTEWAVDLASLTLISGAFFEGVSLAERSQSGRTGDYSSLVFDIFFRSHGNWPNCESVRGRLEDFPEFDDSVIDSYAQRLVKACDVLNGELVAIGSDLSIVGELFGRVKDRSKLGQEHLGKKSETFDQRDLIRPQRNLSPAAPDRYRYELRRLSSGTRIALCHDLELGSQTPLPARPDLDNGYEGSFSWGCSGRGPTFLTISILAHHLGHDDFDTEEIDRLLDAYISRLPEQFIETSFFLTTELIDKCLNE
jgi:hypothetical protein